MKVKPIKSDEARPWLMHKHYAKRCPIIFHAYGLFNDKELVGVVTYGPPPTPAIKQAIFGGEMQEVVLELNRLCVDSEQKNASSILVSGSLSMLPRPSCVVSYADTGQRHIGYIYQATNFLYTGAAVAHDSEYIVSGKKVHARTLASRGITSPKKWAKENDVEEVKPKAKHRYVYFVGSKTQRQRMQKMLAYEIEQYPKGETVRYDASAKVATQVHLI